MLIKVDLTLEGRKKKKETRKGIKRKETKEDEEKKERQKAKNKTQKLLANTNGSKEEGKYRWT